MAVKIEIKGPIVSNATGWLYHWLGWDACCPKDVSDGLAEANGDDVVVEINSGGGVCVYGFEIYNALMQYPGKVTAHVIYAASAASLPVCAADEALASDACIFMIHNTQSYAEGDYRDFQMEADALKEFNAGIINAYVRKTGKSREELQALMDKDTYMSPQKAMEHGFIDGYLYGNPDGGTDENAGVTTNNSMVTVLNAEVPVMTDQKARVITSLIKMSQIEAISVGAGGNSPAGEAEPVESAKAGELPAGSGSSGAQNDSGNTGSDIDATENEDQKGEKKAMTLEEILEEHPEVQGELDALQANAREEGISSERNRLKELDGLSHSVTSDALEKAKYGDKPMDAKELAYMEMMEDGKKAENYMKHAVDDSKDSGVENVGIGLPEQEEPLNESDQLAAHVNKKKKGDGAK